MNRWIDKTQALLSDRLRPLEWLASYTCMPRSDQIRTIVDCCRKINAEDHIRYRSLVWFSLCCMSDLGSSIQVVLAEPDALQASQNRKLNNLCFNWAWNIVRWAAVRWTTYLDPVNMRHLHSWRVAGPHKWATKVSSKRKNSFSTIMILIHPSVLPQVYRWINAVYEWFRTSGILSVLEAFTTGTIKECRQEDIFNSILLYIREENV